MKDDTEDAAGYDFMITSTDNTKWMKYYVQQNNDGTASLYDYGEMQLAKATQKYMKAIVDKSVLGDNVSVLSENETSSEEYTWLTYSENIQFKNGKISLFEYTGV